MERCGLGRSSIYAGVKAGTFPAPVRLSARAVGFLESSIDRWVAQRMAATSTDRERETVEQKPAH
jgi:prophage regulatory protein